LSRVGKNPILVPSGVKVEIDNNEVTVSGPKGELKREVHPSLKVETSENRIFVSRSSNSKFHKSLHGLSRALIANMVEGVIHGYKKALEIQGIGYKAELIGKKLNLSLGFSHPILFSPPEGIKIDLQSPSKIMVSGMDKELVGLVAAKIRSFRPPEPYKGKGIRYEGEVVRKKAGKTAT
jgi:large subunit ribosomal protein L6